MTQTTKTEIISHTNENTKQNNKINLRNGKTKCIETNQNTKYVLNNNYLMNKIKLFADTKTFNRNIINKAIKKYKNKKIIYRLGKCSELWYKNYYLNQHINHRYLVIQTKLNKNRYGNPCCLNCYVYRNYLDIRNNNHCTCFKKNCSLYFHLSLNQRDFNEHIHECKGPFPAPFLTYKKHIKY